MCETNVDAITVIYIQTKDKTTDQSRKQMTV